PGGVWSGRSSRPSSVSWVPADSRRWSSTPASTTASPMRSSAATARALASSPVITRARTARSARSPSSSATHLEGDLGERAGVRPPSIDERRPSWASARRERSRGSLDGGSSRGADGYHLRRENAPPLGGNAGGGGGGRGRARTRRPRGFPHRYGLRALRRSGARAQAVRGQGSPQGEAHPGSAFRCLEPRGERDRDARRAGARAPLLAGAAHDRARRAAARDAGIPCSRPSARATAHRRERGRPSGHEREPIRRARRAHGGGGHGAARWPDRPRARRWRDTGRRRLDDRRLHDRSGEDPARGSDQRGRDRRAARERRLRIGIGADHAGQRLKAAVVAHLAASGHTIVAFGTETAPDDDYPLILRPLADAVARGDVERGLFFCGSGIGPAVAASKIPGVRAAVVENEWSARDAVEHVDVNLLTLGERVLGESLAKSI